MQKIIQIGKNLLNKYILQIVILHISYHASNLCCLKRTYVTNESIEHHIVYKHVFL